LPKGNGILDTIALGQRIPRLWESPGQGMP
jgi:hypothetical protein